MSRRQGLLLLVLFGLGSAAAGRPAASAQGQAAAEASAQRSVWHGVYSEAQARRGLREYTQSCERCHGSDLTGSAVDEIPALVADEFMRHWGRRTVQQLHDRIRKAMPADAPGTLTAAAYLDITAYLLEANGFPHGANDLQRDELGAVVIERAR